MIWRQVGDWITGHLVWVITGAPAGAGTLWWLIRRLRRGLGIGVREAILSIVQREARRRLLIAVNTRRYCKLLLNDERYARLMVPGRRARNIPIDDIFVDLRMNRHANETSEFTNLTLWEAGSRIQVVGNPGSGKTSLVKWALRHGCRKALDAPMRSPLPIYLELRALPAPDRTLPDEDLGSWMLQQVKEKVAALPGQRMGEFFEHCLQSRQSGIMLLLDGLDEVQSTQSARIIEAVNGLARLLAGHSDRNRVVITMRSQFHEQVSRYLDEEFPSVLWVKPFTPADVFEFLARWFPARKHGIDRSVAEVYHELNDRPSLRDLCATPLILAMYVSHHHEVDSLAMPDTRTGFYREVVEELLVQRRVRQQSDHGAPRLPLLEQRQVILARAAFENMIDLSQPTNLLSWMRAVEITTEVAKTAKPEELLRFLATHTGIFMPAQAGESYNFIHQTFCEYLAGFAAAQVHADGWDVLMAAQRKLLASPDVHARVRLMEVIPFAVALLPISRRQAALSDVLGLGDMELYGRCLLQTQDYAHVGWPRYLKDEHAFIANVDSSSWDRQWLERLRLFQTVVGAAEAVMGRLGHPLAETVSIDDLFTDLVGEDKQRLVQIFTTYAAEDPAAALRLGEMCRVDLVRETPELVVEACETPAFLATARTQAERSPESMDRWAEVFVEAALRKRMIADELSSTPASPALLERFKETDEKRRWYVRPIRRAGEEPAPSYYAACLTVVTATNGASTDWASKVGLLRLMTRGPQVSKLRLVSAIGALAAACGFSLPVVIAGIGGRYELWAGVLAVFAAGFVATYICILVARGLLDDFLNVGTAASSPLDAVFWPVGKVLLGVKKSGIRWQDMFGHRVDPSKSFLLVIARRIAGGRRSRDS